MSSSSGHARWPWWLTPLFALCAAGLALVAIHLESGLWVASGGLASNLDRFGEALLEAVALLALDQPGDAPAHVTFYLARIFAVLFAISAAVGIALRISRSARELSRRARFWVERGRAGGAPAVLVGTELVEGPLIGQLRAAGRPVFVVAEDEEDPAVEAARERGALVVVGDPGDAPVRQRAWIPHASELFIATGDDRRNLEIAGRLLAAEPAAPRPGAEAYLHLSDRTLEGTVRARRLLERAGRIGFRTFSGANLVARDLFLELFLDRGRGLLSDPDVGSGATTDDDPPAAVVPSPGEVFHLVLVGFGPTAEAVALHAARFAHFAGHRRPRLTVIGDAAAGPAPWRSFLSRHPAFAPESLDLAAVARLGDAHGWTDRSVRPRAERYRTADPQPSDPPELARERDHAIEYAVDAEYLSSAADVDDDHVLDQLWARLDPRLSPTPAGALVVAFEEEERNFEMAIRLQRALAQRFLGDADAGPTPPGAPLRLPIFAYLSAERGLAGLLSANAARDDATRLVDRHFPIRVFGELDDVQSHDSITQGGVRGHATGLREIHRVLAGGDRRDHTDFDDSTDDAILFAEVKLHALGIRFQTRPPDGQPPLLGALHSPEVQAAFDRLEASAGRGPHGRWTVDPAAFLERVAAEGAVAGPLLERVALSGRLHVPAPGDRTDGAAWDRVEAALRQGTRAAVDRLRKELEGLGGAPLDVAGEMEHNRWMGERLSKGWRLGPRSDLGKQRPTFIPYARLEDRYRLNDLQQLPTLIVRLREADPPRFACLER